MSSWPHRRALISAIVLTLVAGLLGIIKLATAAQADRPAITTYSKSDQLLAYDGFDSVPLWGDDEIAPLTLPFPVPFYGTTYPTAWVDTNGQLTFADQGQPLPDEDLEPSRSGSTC
jgi:hypothetical protein